ncbi:ATP-dependent nuclease [Pseudoxanthomonas sp. 10H]|uniref:ATP-dependent nuclease n=1 Tax=Pseudoxanthomonas sp. 10H TaxID=3242729 RepID=UPI003555D909
MTISFQVLSKGAGFRTGLRGVAQLLPDNWDDFSFKTLFVLHYVDMAGRHVELGAVKIGFKGQTTGRTSDSIPSQFEQLPDAWFSLGQDVDYYANAVQELSEEERIAILSGLRDVAFIEQAFQIAKEESVFETSLLRNVNELTVHAQFRRVLRGEAILSDYQFSYIDPGSDKRASVDLDFRVNAGSRPPTNVHVLIGRNGIGKTTILNGMVKAVHQDYGKERTGGFASRDFLGNESELSHNYFGSVVSVSFSAFDPFVPPPDNDEPKRGPKYFYIGMKRSRLGSATDSATLKSEEDLVDDFASSFEQCMSLETKAKRWLKAIERLSSDVNFAAMELPTLADAASRKDARSSQYARHILGRMSSGHKIVLLTITALVNLVEEKTLVLFDEPESHLHPPLLSAFTRALSELLHDRNGVAIIATHSPVVVQEVPRSCVWILNRSGLQWRRDRPVRETFAENVGILTKEVFGLEVTKSGFHSMLQDAVDAGGTFEEISDSFKNRIGMEGASILAAMIGTRDSSMHRGGN